MAEEKVVVDQRKELLSLEEIMLDPKLANFSDKQKRWIYYFLLEGDSVKASRNAGYANKLDNLKAVGYQMRKKPEVKAYLEDKMREMDIEMCARPEEIFRRLTSIIRGETEEEQAFVLTQEDDEYRELYGKLKKVTHKTQYIQKIKVKPKLSDRIRASELLGKKWGVWKNSEEEEKQATEVVVRVVKNNEDE